MFASSPKASINQVNENLVVVSTDLNETGMLTAEEHAKYPDIKPEHALYGAYKFKATVKPHTDPVAAGTLATLQLDILGNGQNAESFLLEKLISFTEAKPFVQIAGTGVPIDGNYWITKPDSPHARLAKDAVLTMNAPYVLHFVIEDGGSYDIDSVAGTITDPMRLVNTTGVVPTNEGIAKTDPAPTTGGGSSGGCTVGTTAMYDMLLLLLAGIGAIAFRATRRRRA